MIPPLLRENADFRRYWVGQTVSLFGDQISLIALPLTAVLVLHANAAQMGFLTTVLLVPNLLFSLHAGAWVDRRGRRRQTMLATDVGRALLLATVPVAYAFGHLTFAHLYVVAFLTGALSVLFYVAYSALFVALVPRDDFMNANSLLHGSRAFSFLGGPSVGGVLVQLLRAPYALAADVVSFLVSAFFLGRMRVEEPPGATEDGEGVMTGARWLWRSPVMRSNLGAVATINYFNFVFFALFILYATRSLHVRPATLGLVLGAGAVGGVLGSVVTGRISRRIGVGTTFALGCVLFPAPLVLVPAAGGPKWLVLALLFASEFGSGLGVMMLDIAAGSISAAIVPARLRSRVSGAFMVVNYGVRPLGTMTAGALGSWIGLRPTLWFATVGAMLGILWLLPSPIFGLRELPETAE
ncbi:MAG TPA: MFS transporter [Gaiellaceae bacterium]